MAGKAHSPQVAVAGTLLEALRRAPEQLEPFPVNCSRGGSCVLFPSAFPVNCADLRPSVRSFFVTPACRFFHRSNSAA